MLLRSWGVAGLALALLPVSAPRSPLSASATDSLLQRLTICAQPQALTGVRLEATESWTLAGAAQAGAVETDDVLFYRGVALEMERSQNDRPLSPRAEGRQQRMAAVVEARVDAAQAAGGKQLLNLHGEIWPMAQLVAQFQWRAEAAAPGQVELDFTPRPGIRPSSRMQRLLSHTAGDFIVDAASGQILSGAFHNLAPVDFGAGVLARFTQFSGHFALQPAGSAWVMREVVITVRGRELLRRIRGTETMEYRLLGER